MHGELGDSQRRPAVTVSRSDSQYLHNDSTAAVQCAAQARCYPMHVHTVERNNVVPRRVGARKHTPSQVLTSDFQALQQCHGNVCHVCGGTRFSLLSFESVISPAAITLPTVRTR